jgi:hypothetical protein
MNIEILAEDRKLATEKWREYKEAAKKTRDPIYEDLKKVYNQIKNGKEVIDIFDAIQGGGIYPDTCHPKLAIAKATSKKVFCTYWQHGKVRFKNEEHGLGLKADIILDDCLPVFKMQESWRSLELSAPVPTILPRLRPAKLTDDYYILWEVDSWTPLPSRDPYLLKRITSRMFVVCAAWDLTDIEMKVMAGRVKS